MPIVNLTTSFLGIIPPNNPVVTFVSATGDSITVNITNPNEYSVKAYYGHTNPNPTLNTTISANSNQNVTVTGLTAGTNYTIYVYLENTENNSTSTTVSVLSSTPSELYAFTSHTFSSAGVTGIDGPNLTQVRSAYTSQSWAQNSSFLNVTGGIQYWTVPVSGNYRILAVGGSGGSGNNSGPGRGAAMRADVSLTQGEIIRILVGQGGARGESSCDPGGGGGTFVIRTPYNTTNSILVIAGGGAGGGSAQFGSSTKGGDGLTTNAGGSGQNGTSGGTGGNGGTCGYGSPGAGFTGNGCQPSWGSFAGVNNGVSRSFTNGGQGASSTQASPNRIGGFGGGGSAHGNCCVSGGGGGGYSGGASGGSYCFAGGGGGSFIITTANNIATSTGTYNGSSTFNGVNISNLGYSSGGTGPFGEPGYVTITKL